MVVQIVSKETSSHLVAIVKGMSAYSGCGYVNRPLIVPEAESRSDLSSPWFVFNDFSVRNISEEEALSFPSKWNVCILSCFIGYLPLTCHTRSQPFYTLNGLMSATV